MAHVLWSGDIGGIGRLVSDLATTQVSEGLEVIATFARAQGPFVEAIRAGKAEVVELGFERGYDLRSGRVRAAARCLSRADVVHLHGYNFVFAAAARQSKRPIVFTEHGNFGQGRSLGLGHRVKERFKARFLGEAVTVLAANSAYTTARLANLYGISDKGIHVVYNGISLPTLECDPSHTGSRSDALRVAFVGRLAGFKRVDRVIDAVAQMRDPSRVRITIAGSGPLEADLRGRAVAAGVARHVNFVGWTQDVASLLQSADSLVQPSEGEPFGLAIVEGCAVGVLPIVFADGGGALEVIPPDGIVVRDASELAAVFERLPGSALISTAARKARAAWAREHFPISQTHEKYLELYRLALRGRST